VYSLTVTLFSLLLGTGFGSLLSRRVEATRVQRTTVRALVAIVIVTAVSTFALPAIIDLAIPAPLAVRVLAAVAILMPIGVLLGMALPGGMRLLASTRQDIVAWGWGINGAFSVVGATLAVFIAMNWGFSVTLLAGGLVYAGAAATLATR
jgi:predicted membrane-bound spermidine synthase